MQGHIRALILDSEIKTSPPPQPLANALVVTSTGICMMGLGPGLHLCLLCRAE